jgi:hypothetical protein
MAYRAEAAAPGEGFSMCHGNRNGAEGKGVFA